MITEFFNQEDILQYARNEFGIRGLLANITDYKPEYRGAGLKLNDLTGIEVKVYNSDADMVVGSPKSDNGSFVSKDKGLYVNLPVDTTIDKASSETATKAVFRNARNAIQIQQSKVGLSIMHQKGDEFKPTPITSPSEYVEYLGWLGQKLDIEQAPQEGRFAVLPTEMVFQMVQDDALSGEPTDRANIDGFMGFYGNIAIYTGGSEALIKEKTFVIVGGSKLASVFIEEPINARIVNSQKGFIEKAQVYSKFGVGVGTPRWLGVATYQNS